MQHINGAYTNYFNTKRKRSGHLFQGRFKAILIEADKYATELSRYIHMNPVRAGMTKRPEEYPWSSYRDYIGKRIAPGWLKTGFVLGYFGNMSSAAGGKYQKFVEDLLNKQYESPLNSAVAATMLGCSEFIQEITDRYLSDKQMDRDLPALRTLSKRPPLDAIVQTVKSIVGDQARLAEKVSIYLCHKYSGAKLKEIGERFGIGQSSVTQASRRFARQMVTDATLRKLVAHLEEEIRVSIV
jgi:hypothetical protein